MYPDQKLQLGRAMETQPCDSGGRELAVPAALQALRASTDMLHDVLSNLESRLAPAMSKACDKEPGSEGAPYACDLQGAVQDCHGGVSAAIRRVQSILQRLEV